MIIYTHEQLAEQIGYFLTQDAFAFDVETLAQPDNEQRGNPRLNRVHWLSLATNRRTISIPLGFPNGVHERTEFPLTPTGEKWVAEGKVPRANHYSRDKRKAIEIFGPPPEHMRFDTAVKEILEPLFFSDRLKIAHNLKFDATSLAKHFGGRILPGPYFDTMIAPFVLDMRLKGRLDLAACVEREIGYKMTKGVGADISKHAFDEVARYGYIDVHYDWLLSKEYRAQIPDQGAQELFDLEMEVLEAVCHMEHTGAPVDVSVLEQLGKEFTAAKERIEEEIYRLTGEAWNIGSNAERQRKLYLPKDEGGLALRQTVLTTGGKAKQTRGEDLTISDLSVAEKALEKFAARVPLVANLMEWEKYDKLLTSFIVPYIGGEVQRTTNNKTKIETRASLLVNGRIHAKFNQIGTDTGRFSSSNPNFQQVPSRSEEGKKIRSAVLAPPGDKLVTADYSQIEPRILADQSESKVLIDTYLNGGDIYTTLAAPFGIDRFGGKTLFLSISYGVGPDKLAGQLGITLKAAKELLYEQFKDEFPEIDRLKRRIIREAKTRNPPYVETLFGRRRYLPELWSSDRTLKSRAERQGFNAYIQGSAADINKYGIVQAFRTLPKGAQLILTVHDENVVLTPEHLAEETALRLREAMEGVKALNKVPLVAEAKITDNWAEGK